MNKLNEILNDVIHTASQAIISDEEKIKRQAMADIVDALASVIPAELVTARGGARALPSDGRACRTPVATADAARFARGIPATAETATNDPQGFAKFLKASDGVQFVRFHGKEVTRLVASRRGRCGNQNTIFEINVDHKDNFATVTRDGKVMFDIQGETIGHSFVEKLAISSMHRYFKENSMTNAKKKRKRARKAAELEGK